MTGTHALIMDDNANNLGVLAELLSMEGVTVTKLQDPTKFAAMSASLPPVDVVFLDLEMPGVTGYKMLEVFKADARFKNTPIVAYTVHVSEINVARQLGFHSFLGKPLDAERFPNQLARILRGEPVWGVSSSMA
jgi:two-component system, cell cycle response regulator DivK